MGLSTRIKSSPLFHNLWPVVLTVALYVLVREWADVVLKLDETAYRSSIIGIEIVLELVTTLPGLVGLIPLCALFIFRWSELRGPWTEFEGARHVRLLVNVLVVLMTWSLATTDFNLYFNRGYDVDRLVIVALTPLVIWRPVFLVPYVFLVVPIDHQFDHPFGRQIFARQILENLLVLFFAGVLVRGLTRRRETTTLMFVAFSLLASYYWYPGYTKLVRDWISYGSLYLGGFASYANGWLAAMPYEGFLSLMRVGALVDWPGRILTLVSELAAIFFFFHRLIPRVLLPIWAALHVGIWLFSGVSFLVWIVLDLTLLILFFSRSASPYEFFSREWAVGGLALIVCSPYWVHPPQVGWYDTSLVYTYRYEAVDERGARAAFSADTTPLGEAWCARDFPFLSERSTLPIRYGKTNLRAVADSVKALNGDPRGISALEESFGHVHSDSVKAEVFDRYISRIAQNWNRRKTSRHWLSWASPPRTCLSPRSPPETSISADRDVKRIVVYQLTFFFDGENFGEIRRDSVRAIAVPDG